LIISKWFQKYWNHYLKCWKQKKRDQAISIVPRSILHDNKWEEIKKYPNALLCRLIYHNNISVDGKLQIKKDILCKIIWKNWWWEMGINNGKAKMMIVEQ